MSKEKETEKIISDKLNSREFAFDEKAWAGMETLLDAQQKKRRFGFFWWFSVAGVFLTVMVSIVYYFTIDSKNQNLKSFTNFTGNEVFSEQNDASLQQNEASLEKKEGLLEKKKALLQQDDASLEKKETSLQQNKTSLEKKEALLEKKVTSSDKKEALFQQNEASLEKKEASLQQNDISSEENKAPMIENNTNSEEKTTSQEVDVANNVFSEADSTKTAEQTLLTDSASLAETAKNLLTAPGKETKNAWGVLAGVGAWKPYQIQMQGEENKDMIGFTGGIYYQRTCAKLIDLSFGILYSSRGGLNYDKTIVNSEYGFGVESNKTIISPQTLHYLNIPLTLRFNISQRSHVQIGAEYYHLMATTSKISYITENSFGISEPYSEERQTGNHLGFRKYDIAAFLGYEFTLLDRMNAALQLHYGFYDNTDINYYAGEIFGRNANGQNISLQLHLKYDLIRH